MNGHSNLLINLLPYRPMTTGLSRYAERLLKAWPREPLPWQLQINDEGKCELKNDQTLPETQPSGWMRQLQNLSIVQHGLKIRELVKDLSLDCIYSPYTDYIWDLPNTPQVITCHDLIPLYYPNSNRSYWRSKLWLSRHLQQATRVVAISNTVADQLMEQGLPAARIAVIKNGIEPFPEPIEAPKSQDCIILARHSRNKNIKLALSGFAKLLKTNSDWPGKLIVVGRGDRSTKDLQLQTKELKLEKHLIWITHLSERDLLHVLQGAFCLISPSLMEGFDYPLIEAQSLGIPTLASDIPAHRELHSSVSLFFDLNDGGESMANQLARLKHEPKLWNQLSQAGRGNAMKFTSAQQTKELLNLVEDVIRGQ